jgi:Domain of unknown function (DUF4440)
MRNLSTILCFLFIIFFLPFSSTAQNTYGGPLSDYKPDDQKLFNTILHMDSVFFNAYNTCSVHLENYAAIYSDSIEFYHDKGGIMTSKKDIVDATKRNICGKVTRELVPGTVEVYPINNYGAVEIGFHKFHNNQEKEGTPSRPGRFVIIWQYKSNEWKITRVVSLH